MVEAAVADVPGLEAGRLEIELGGPSYTADTLAALADASPAPSCSRSSATTPPPA